MLLYDFTRSMMCDTFMFGQINVVKCTTQTLSHNILLL